MGKARFIGASLAGMMLYVILNFVPILNFPIILEVTVGYIVGVAAQDKIGGFITSGAMVLFVTVFHLLAIIGVSQAPSAAVGAGVTFLIINWFVGVVVLPVTILSSVKMRSA